MLGSRRTKDFQAISGCMLLQNCGDKKKATAFFDKIGIKSEKMEAPEKFTLYFFGNSL